MGQETIGQAIWSGDYWGRNGAIERARREYENFTQSTLEEPPEVEERRLVYMNALYSALASVIPSAKRRNPIAIIRAVSLVCALRPFLMLYAEDVGVNVAEEKLTADRMEMIAAMLVKYADVPRFGGEMFREAAIHYAVAAINRLTSDPVSHTPALAALTLARADIAVEGKEGLSREHLRFAEKRAVSVADVNQRARIFRSLAEVWSDLAEKEKAREFIDRAQAVPGIDADVLAKIREVSKTIRS